MLMFYILVQDKINMNMNINRNTIKKSENNDYFFKQDKVKDF